ncbi:hypothetical protein QBC47DRAFT_383726 [Echria macrotheca]|uniref:Geranylgeranyl transferase type-2 subunit alpha n=1 Tax=Echria macrotheca TaxID=438768 RepID=A0AAJ0BCP7_9PEZI|nr:hypothetical protein QBC47DRAFT_383726 [Echria macrotheca]
MAEHGGSHGGIARTSRERTASERQADLDRIARYRALEDEIRTRVAASGDSAAAVDLFHLTSKLLRLNPEYYTIWNVRRRSLTSGLLSRRSAACSPSRASLSGSRTATTTPPSASSSSTSSTATPHDQPSPTAGRSGTLVDDNDGKKDAELLEGELRFTFPLLLESPKCYWLWNYRLWILGQAIERLPTAAARRMWEDELGLASKMLTKDQRNFHAWGYRRHVVNQLESPALGGSSMVEAEFAYTDRMTRANLSNFSAWHRRSKLIPRLLDERGADDLTRKSFLDQELGTVNQLLSVDPKDQSLWYYHQFLMLNLLSPVGRPTITPAFSLEDRLSYIMREIEGIKDLLESYEDEELDDDDRDAVKQIYKALLDYTLALCQLEGRQPDGQERELVAGWLRELRVLDPMRDGRWTDLERDYGLRG